MQQTDLEQIVLTISDPATQPDQVAAPAQEAKKRDDGIMWVSAREVNMTKRMNYLAHRLTTGQTTKLHAYGLAIGSAVWMACTMRNQLGGVTTKAQIMELKDEEKQRKSFGIEITLSRSAETPLPERKPYVKKADKVEKEGKSKPKTAERLDSAEKADTAEKTVTVESAVQTVKPSRSKSRKVSPRTEQAPVPAEAPQKRDGRADYATQKLAEYKTRTNGKFYDDGLADDKRHFTQYQRGRGNF